MMSIEPTDEEIQRVLTAMLQGDDYPTFWKMARASIIAVRSVILDEVAALAETRAEEMSNLAFSHSPSSSARHYSAGASAQARSLANEFRAMKVSE